MSFPLSRSHFSLHGSFDLLILIVDGWSLCTVNRGQMCRVGVTYNQSGLPYLVNDHLRITIAGIFPLLVGDDGSERLARSYLAFFS